MKYADNTFIYVFMDMVVNYTFILCNKIIIQLMTIFTFLVLTIHLKNIIQQLHQSK